MASSETNLPFVGTKVSLSFGDEGRVDVVIHSSGIRDLTFFGPGEQGSGYPIRLDPTSACALGALLCAAIQHPPS